MIYYIRLMYNYCDNYCIIIFFNKFYSTKLTITTFNKNIFKWLFRSIFIYSISITTSHLLDSRSISRAKKLLILRSNPLFDTGHKLLN